jgi:hypothetical protein
MHNYGSGNLVSAPPAPGFVTLHGSQTDFFLERGDHGPADLGVHPSRTSTQEPDQHCHLKGIFFLQYHVSKIVEKCKLFDLILGCSFESLNSVME